MIGTRHKSKPPLRFPEFTGEWELCELDNLFKERIEWPNLALPLYSLTIESGIVPKTERYERGFLVKSEERAYKVMYPDDFAFNPMNLRFGALARFKGRGKIRVSKYYNIFYCTSKSDPTFCENYLTSHSMIQFYNHMATGSLDEKKRVHFLDFLKFQLRFPTLAEQKRIAAFLLAIDQKIALLSQKIDLLRKYKKSVMQHIFTQRIRFKNDTGNAFPDWAPTPMRNVLSERKSYAKKNATFEHISLTVEGVVPKSARYERDFLVGDETNKEYKITYRDDICYNPANLKFGVIARNKYGDGIFSPIYVTFEVKKDDTRFVEYLVIRKDFIDKIRRYEEGTVYERMAVKPADFLSETVLMPGLAEQTKIADFLSSIEKKIDLTNAQLDDTRVFKRGLLQQMFV